MARSLWILVLGGTSWLGGTVASAAVSRGHQVTCLARGESGSVPPGAEHVVVDRWSPDAYVGVAASEWDAVLDLSWQPELVRSALTALAPRARSWIYVSSVSVYSDHSVVDADESAALVDPWSGSGPAGLDEYAGAKVSCETACRDAVAPDRLLVARPGLIAGYGDRSDRFGYWPGRLARATRGDVVLTPPHDTPVQVIDVADVARWLVDSVERATSGTFDIVGGRHTFADLFDLCSRVAGVGPKHVEASEDWLLGAGVEPWAGPASLPLWLPRDEYQGMVSRSGGAARAEGLAPRPLSRTVADALRWETELGLDRDRQAGLAPACEDELVRRLG